MTIKTATVLRGVRRMALQVGVSPGHLSRVLNGERTPGSRLQIELLARGVDLERPAKVRAARKARGA